MNFRYTPTKEGKVLLTKHAPDLIWQKTEKYPKKKKGEKKKKRKKRSLQHFCRVFVVGKE